MSAFRTVPANTAGRDLAVGDIHGHFDRLQQALDRAGFDPGVDRLFSVGDLIDRGPDSARVLEWLDLPWFHAVQGNHEALAITHARGGHVDLRMYRSAGGAWFLDLPPKEQARIAERLEALPVAMQVQTAFGAVGLIHADSPFATWQQLQESLENDDPQVREVCQWSRRRLRAEDDSLIEGIDAVVVGHTPVGTPRVLGNVWHLDTAGWSSGFFSLLNIASLTLVTPAT